MSSQSSFPEKSRVMCYLNGKFIPFEEARLPVYDLAIMQGATVTERLRTAQHVPFDVPGHLARIESSLSMVQWKNFPSMESLSGWISEVVEQNVRWIDTHEDLAVVLFISAGQGLGDANGLLERSEPTVCVYTAPLPFSHWVDGYTRGVDLLVPEIRQLPGNCLNPHIKMRSRLHWHLADHWVKEQNPAAMALLLDQGGHITETSSGNLLLVKGGRILSPAFEKTLPGRTRQILQGICQAEQVPFEFRDLSISEAMDADEAFLTSSTYCLMPVRTLNRHALGTGTPGPITRTLMSRFAAHMGLDFVAQAVQSQHKNSCR